MWWGLNFSARKNICDKCENSKERHKNPEQFFHYVIILSEYGVLQYMKSKLKVLLREIK